MFNADSTGPVGSFVVGDRSCWISVDHRSSHIFLTAVEGPHNRPCILELTSELEVVSLIERSDEEWVGRRVARSTAVLGDGSLMVLEYIVCLCVVVPHCIFLAG